MARKLRAILYVGLGVFGWFSCKKKLEPEDTSVLSLPKQIATTSQKKEAPPPLSKENVAFLKACEAGNMDACSSLGLAYHKGIGVGKNIKQAYALWEKACAGGDGRGCEDLAILYLYEKEFPKDIKKALDALWKACNLGKAEGCNSIGALYVDGTIAEKDYQLAMELFQKACKLGSTNGCENLDYWKGNMPSQEVARFLHLQLVNPEIDTAWRMLKFGGVIENKGDYEIIDAEITCQLLAESETKLGEETQTVYQKFPPHQKKEFKNIRISMIPAQSHHTTCVVTKAKFSQKD